MARSNSFRTFMVDGRAMVFDPNGLSAAIEQMHSGTKVTRNRIYEDIAEACCVSDGAVKNWKYGNNGPDALETIKKAAEVLGVPYESLLEDRSQIMQENEVTLFNQINTESEKEFVRQYYQRLVDYTYDYIGTVDTCYKNSGSKEYDYGDAEFNLYRALDKAALYISSDVYDKLHRITTELVSFLPPWITFPERWNQINERMIIVGYLVMDTEFLYDLNSIDSEKYNEFMTEYLQETGYSLTDAMEHTDRIESFMYIARETARTIKLLFQQEFKEIL